MEAIVGRQEGKLLGRGRKPRIRSRYPYMLDKDHAKWTAFLRSRILKLDQVWYGVYVYTYREVREGSRVFMRGIGVGVHRKRIDVVGRIGRTVFIFKIQNQVSPATIRSLVKTRNIFLREFKVHGPVQAVIIAATADADMHDIAGRLKVRIIDAGRTRVKARREI